MRQTQNVRRMERRWSVIKFLNNSCLLKNSAPMEIDKYLLDLFKPKIEFEELSIPSKHLLLEEGTVADKLFLIKKGCLRLFFYNDGKDISFQFFFEGDFVASFDSMYNCEPSLYSLGSIEPSEILVVQRDDFFNLIENDSKARQFFEQALINRFHVYQTLFLSRIKNTPQQRYEELLKNFPNIIQRIPQHYIASYLGITSVSLSRIRNRQ